MLTAFLHGYLLSFGLIIPVGPQNAFVLAQGASQPRWLRALPVAILAAISDTLLILLAVLGVSTLVLTLPVVRTVLVVIGVGFLIVMGWLIWHTEIKPTDGDQAGADWPFRRQAMFALSVSLLNPHAILDTIGVIGTSAIAYPPEGQVGFAAGCILNSWLWFIALTLVGRMMGTVEAARRWLNRASAVIMWISAAYLAISLLGV